MQILDGFGKFHAAAHGFLFGTAMGYEYGAGSVHDLGLERLGVLPKVGGCQFFLQGFQFLGSQLERRGFVRFDKTLGVVLHRSIIQKREFEDRAVAAAGGGFERDQGLTSGLIGLCVTFFYYFCKQKRPKSYKIKLLVSWRQRYGFGTSWRIFAA
ncbi:MAG: hypothetical protein HC788_14610 [Sphingopyxis sp.]|nr:hypothetical protein [Sphingopyxis sp.]